MRRALACAALLALLVIAGCAPKKPSVALAGPQFPDFIFPAPIAAASGQAGGQRDAWTALQNGNIGAADKQLNRLLQRSPSDASLVAGLGYVSLARHDLAQALTRFDQATTPLIVRTIADHRGESMAKNAAIIRFPGPKP